LIELILVITVMGLIMGLVSLRLGAFNFWKEEAALRRMAETMVLLHNQAVMDQAYYRVEFDLEKNSYRVGTMRTDDSSALSAGPVNLPILSMELASLLSPSLSGETTMIPPPSFPSLAEPTILPGEMVFEDIVTPRGKTRRDDKQENPFLLFSPRGFSEFGVIHLTMGGNKPVTVLVNPWTGLAEVYREYKEFKWTLGKQEN